MKETPHQVNSIKVSLNNMLFYCYLQSWRNSMLQSYDNGITARKQKFTIKNFFSKYEQIRRKIWICSHLLKKILIRNLFFCAVITSISRASTLHHNTTTIETKISPFSH